EVANRLAPEHLELAVREPRRWAKGIRHAGAIFVGQGAPEAFGDYLAGPNHVLPTGGTARFASPLGVYDFVKRTSMIEATPRALAARTGRDASRAAGGPRRARARSRATTGRHGRSTLMAVRARRAPAAPRGRQGTVVRRTKETDIRLELGLDGRGRYEVSTGI